MPGFPDWSHYSLGNNMNQACLVLQGLMFLDVPEHTDVRKASSLHTCGTREYNSGLSPKAQDLSLGS